MRTAFLDCELEQSLMAENEILPRKSDRRAGKGEEFDGADGLTLRSNGVEEGVEQEEQ